MSEWILMSDRGAGAEVVYPLARGHIQAVEWLLNSDVGQALKPTIRAVLRARAKHDPASFETYWRRGVVDSSGARLEIRYWLEPVYV